MKKDILVPYDGSKNATEALHLAITLAKLLQEKLIVLNVQPSFRTVHTKMFFSEQTIHEYQEQLFRETVAPAKEILEGSGIEYKLKLRIGDAKEQIHQEATLGNTVQPGCATTGVRMIIMGSRGMNPILGGVLGSVSYGVVNSAPCPVTIVPFSCSE
ncbi:MAG TPA: universal stress protein [Methylomusa anaerophila]|uniref:Putative universal stress protein n=1 Tax=Methylomusa anaerophila TaxID=1930071 RepID=A0A348AFX1_9FIRM|nr:universal stress protein [Methylomusa anaerophila]BBB89969.1 putative universal stress protein [Methylomusa anaerophila]HML88304.1 universal stress protein [Methylomusa anaerophila]